MQRLKRTMLAITLACAPTAMAAQDFDAGYEAWVAGDFKAAFREWQPLAQRGHPEAQRSLGYMYEHGIGVEEDDIEAARLYRQAALRGNVEAQFRIGYMTANGNGTPQDFYLAHIWLNVAGANGYDEAHGLRDLVAKKMHPGDVLRAQRRANECIESGYAECGWPEPKPEPTS